MNRTFILSAKRTAVVPANGAFAGVEAFQLGAGVIRALCDGVAFDPALRIEIVMGNALYGGGNIARVAALAAGLSERIPAMTIDTQCCSGLDAIALGRSRIMSGDADIVIAGGIESFSRAPLRQIRPAIAGEAPRYYKRPPFTPWPERDPDLTEAAATLAIRLQITRAAQETYAMASHRKALQTGSTAGEVVEIAGIARDQFARRLSPQLCARLPWLVGETPYDLTAATIAVEADAAAAVLIASEPASAYFKLPFHPIEIVGAASHGFDPSRPALAPIGAAQEVLGKHGVVLGHLTAVEIMEAYAVQAQAFVDALAIDPAVVNRGGGALARGHPIGASGAILAVRLFHELQRENEGATGLAAIAAAGGLGSAMLLRR